MPKKDNMKTRYVRLIILAWLFVSISTISVLADGLPIKDGRYSGGAVVIIELTQEQQKIIIQRYKPYCDLKLTKEQIEYIKKTVKMIEAPTKLFVVRPADTVGDCTCGLANLGLIFKDNAIE